MGVCAACGGGGRATVYLGNMTGTFQKTCPACGGTGRTRPPAAARPAPGFFELTPERRKLLASAALVFALLGGIVARAVVSDGRQAAQRAADEAAAPRPAGPSPQQARDAEQSLAAVGLAILATVERQLDRDEEFVRSVEAILPALREGRQAEARARQDEAVERAAAAIGRRRSQLAEIRGGLPDADRARAAAAESRCAALVERLNRCRQPDARAAPGGE